MTIFDTHMGPTALQVVSFMDTLIHDAVQCCLYMHTCMSTVCYTPQQLIYSLERNNMAFEITVCEYLVKTM